MLRTFIFLQEVPFQSICRVFLVCGWWPWWSPRWGRGPQRAQWSSEEIYQVRVLVDQNQAVHYFFSFQEQKLQISHNGWKNHLMRWILLLLFSNIYSRPYEGWKIGCDSCWKVFEEVLFRTSMLITWFSRDPQDVEVILTAPETQDEGVWKYEHLR